MDDEELISRRDRLRQEREERHRAREEQHSSPTRVRLRLAAVAIVLGVLLSWLLVSWLVSSPVSSEDLPEPPEQVAGGSRPLEESPEAEGAGSEDAGPEDAGGEEAGTAVVHVGGAVQDPGVVEVPAGARVHEAVEEVGGFTEEAAPEGLNLAAEVQDGVLIWVPTQEELDSGEASPAEMGQGGGAADSAETGLINLNTADAATLEELPGIGPALAERIIGHREAHGDFGSLEELAAVSGIGPAILADVEDLVTW